MGRKDELLTAGRGIFKQKGVARDLKEAAGDDGRVMLIRFRIDFYITSGKSTAKHKVDCEDKTRDG